MCSFKPTVIHFGWAIQGHSALLFRDVTTQGIHVYIFTLWNTDKSIRMNVDIVNIWPSAWPCVSRWYRTRGETIWTCYGPFLINRLLQWPCQPTYLSNKQLFDPGHTTLLILYLWDITELRQDYSSPAFFKHGYTFLFQFSDLMKAMVVLSVYKVLTNLPNCTWILCPKIFHFLSLPYSW